MSQIQPLGYQKPRNIITKFTKKSYESNIYTMFFGEGENA